MSQKIAEQAVERFHSQLRSGDYHTIYVEAGDEFRNGTNEADFVKFMEAANQQLGIFQHTNPRTYQVGWFLGKGTLVTLTYETQFTNGAGTEQFVWHIKTDHALLVGYHVTPTESVSK